MTNSSKKPAKASRDNFDLDLDARIEEASSSLPIDDEPPVGDNLDKILERAKKAIEEDLPKKPKVTKKIENDDFNLDDLLNETVLDLDDDLKNVDDLTPKKAIKSPSITSLENQLTAAMQTPNVIDDAELDNLLGHTGFDFDSLLGESASDELPAADLAETEEASLLAAVDELLNVGISEKELEKAIEPSVVLEDIIEPELEPVVEPEVILDKEEAIQPKEKTIEPNVALQEIIEPELKPTIEPVVILEEVEEAIQPEENELGLNQELTVEPEVALADLVDSVPFEDATKTVEDEAENDNFAEEFNDFAEVADSVAPLVEISTSDKSFDDDLIAMQQLDDGLNEAMENKNDTATGFDLLDDDAPQNKDVTTTVESEDDWMKQLEDLPEIKSSQNVDLEKADDSTENDWMKQLDDLDAQDASESVSLKKSETVEDVADDDDWMKQLEGLDEETSDVVDLDKKNDADAAGDDDWMKQLEGIEEHDEETANMLLDAVHEAETENEIVDSNFNIANEVEPKTTLAQAIDEDALVAKAADLAISQFKDEFKDDQDHAFSQLRADQDAIETKSRKQFADAEEKRKKTAVFGYVALGVGVIGLLGSAGIGVLSYGTKGEMETVTQSVTELEEKVEGLLAKNPEKDIANIKTSVEQLNQKVEKLEAAQAALVVPTPSAAVDATKAATPTETGKTNAAVTLNKPAQTSPLIEVPKVAPETSAVPSVDIPAEKKIDEKEDDAKAAQTAKKAAETAKAEAAKLAKAEAAKVAKAEAELLSQKIAKANAIAKSLSSPAPVSKVEEKRNALTEKATRYTGRMTRGMARGVQQERNESKTKAVASAPKKEILNTAVTPQKPVSAGKYSVNVVSYQQEWFAQSKAAEFKQKGIPVEVVPVDINNHATRYRLKVPGFKNKTEAAAYAEKIKKSHNLSESWVGVNE